MRTSEKKLNKSLENQIKKAFSQMISDISSPAEVETFMKDFFSESEYEIFTKRLAIAYWLKKGRSYENIKNNLKVSSATIANVQNIMDKPGMQMALKRIEAEEWANQWAEKIKAFIPSKA